MVELISKISKGSKMDQIYLPKNRTGFNTGEYVLISPLKNKIEEQTAEKQKLFFYNTEKLEPIKIKIIEEIILRIDNETDSENIIITGSFLDNGFTFNDIDILLISKEKLNTEIISKKIQESLGIKPHILILNNQALLSGLSTDPLYSLMLSKCVSKKRIIFNVKRRIEYKLLDINLLKSKTLIDNFDMLNGNEKYYLVKNMISILLFVKGKKLNKNLLDKEIEKLLGTPVKEIRENLIKKPFIKRYKKVFDSTLNLILNNIKGEK